MPKDLIFDFMLKEWIKSPIGNVCIISENEYPVSISFVNNNSEITPLASLSKASKALYFFFAKKEPSPIEISLDHLEGTAFQKKVWSIICAIPFGKTLTYGEIALQVGDKNASRAVGLATGKNPIAIAIPCHRVVGVDHKLTGYAWGIKRKKWLLEFEQSLKQGSLF